MTHPGYKLIEGRSCGVYVARAYRRLLHGRERWLALSEGKATGECFTAFGPSPEEAKEALMRRMPTTTTPETEQ